MRWLALISLCIGLPARAMVLDLPADATVAYHAEEPNGRYNLPVAPWANGTMETQSTEGRVLQKVWQVPSGDLSTLQLIQTLKDQLVEQGFAVRLDCETDTCGGFDFRFGTAVAPEPLMHVNLGDFRFLSATKNEQAISVLVSRSSETCFVQVTHVGPQEAAQETDLSTKATDIIGDPAPPVPETPEDFGALLESDGHVILKDLEFQVGSSELTESTPESLINLARYLTDYPDRRVTIVGHTDTQGSLSANINLSKRRAASVVERLVSEFGISAARLTPEGMGYLAPLTTNLTDEGRSANRRVEVILLGIE